MQVWEISPRVNSAYVIREIVVRYRMDTHGLSRAPVIFVVHDTIANQSVLSKFNVPLHARTIDPREPSFPVVTDLPRFTYKHCFDPDHVFRIRENRQLKMLQRQL
jgi:hypothetical protein